MIRCSHCAKVSRALSRSPALWTCSCGLVFCPDHYNEHAKECDPLAELKELGDDKPMPPPEKPGSIRG